MSQTIPNDYTTYKRTIQPSPFNNPSMQEESFRKPTHSYSKPGYQSYPRPKLQPQPKSKSSYHKPQQQYQQQYQQPQQPLLHPGENAILVENLNVNFNEKTVRAIFRTFGPIQRVQFVDASTV